MCRLFKRKKKTVQKEIEDGIAESTKEQAHDKRKRREDHWIGIMIHHTGVGGRKEVSDELWAKLYKNLGNFLMRKDDRYVSAHYIIGHKGETKELVDPRTHEAFHAGKSSWWHPVRRKFVSDLNAWTVGIELVGDGNIHPYSKEQYKALTDLCLKLMKRFPTIQANCIMGHEMASPGRKPDPGRLFKWEEFFKGLYVRLP